MTSLVELFQVQHPKIFKKIALFNTQIIVLILFDSTTPFWLENKTRDEKGIGCKRTPLQKHIMQPAYRPPTHPQQAKMATYTALFGMFGSFFFFEPRPAGGL